MQKATLKMIKTRARPRRRTPRPSRCSWPITYTAVSGMPVSQAGVASGIASTSRQIGQVLGIAVTGSILAGNLRGRPLRDGFVTASHAGWLLLAAMGAVIVVLGLVTASRWALGTAARPA